MLSRRETFAISMAMVCPHWGLKLRSTARKASSLCLNAKRQPSLVNSTFVSWTAIFNDHISATQSITHWNQGLSSELPTSVMWAIFLDVAGSESVFSMLHHDDSKALLHCGCMARSWCQTLKFSKELWSLSSCRNAQYGIDIMILEQFFIESQLTVGRESIAVSEYEELSIELYDNDLKALFKRVPFVTQSVTLLNQFQIADFRLHRCLAFDGSYRYFSH